MKGACHCSAVCTLQTKRNSCQPVTNQSCYQSGTFLVVEWDDPIQVVDWIDMEFRINGGAWNVATSTGYGIHSTSYLHGATPGQTAQARLRTRRATLTGDWLLTNTIVIV